jgi:hypothetical protein
VARRISHLVLKTSFPGKESLFTTDMEAYVEKTLPDPSHTFVKQSD